MKNMINYHLLKLGNGLKIYFIKKPGNSLDVSLFINVGSVNENKQNNGVSHLLEHLIFWETKKDIFYPLGLEIQAATRKDFTLFGITTHKKYFEKVLAILSSLVLKPNFDQKNLRSIKDIIKEEMSDFFDNPYNILDYESDKNLFKGSSLSLNIAGSEKSISRISLLQLKKWHIDYYNPKNMVLTVVGDVDIEKAKKDIQKCFKFENNSLEKNSEAENDYKFPIKHKFAINSGNFQQSYIALVYPIGAVGNKNYFKELMLGEIINNKLRINLKNDGLFYDLSVSNNADKYSGDINIITSCDHENSGRVIKLLEDEIKNIEIEDNFFEKTKDYFRHKILLKEDDVDDLSSLTLYLLAGFSKPVSVKDEVKMIDSVDLNDIQRLKGEIFNDGNKFVFVLSPKMALLS